MSITALLRPLLLSLVLLLCGSFAQAQALPTASHGYDFLTVTAVEGSTKNYARILFSPAFLGKSEVALEEYSGLGAEKYFDKIQRNTQTINQQLSDLTAAGWELVDVHVAPVSGPTATRYLFRKAKP